MQETNTFPVHRGEPRSSQKAQVARMSMVERLRNLVDVAKIRAVANNLRDTGAVEFATDVIRGLRKDEPHVPLLQDPRYLSKHFSGRKVHVVDRNAVDTQPGSLRTSATAH